MDKEQKKEMIDQVIRGKEEAEYLARIRNMSIEELKQEKQNLDQVVVE
jgi:hypothetical protein